jgi:hypothetical protein
MKLAGVVHAAVQTLGEKLGLGAVREARLLVGKLPPGDLLVATAEEPIARALGRARHRRALVDGSGLADAALSRELPDDDEGLALIERLAAATREGGVVIVARPQPLGRSTERTRAAGLFLRVGLVELRQESDGGTVFTSGRVRRAQ